MISSLKFCQLCHASDHTVDVCTNMNKVRVAERCVNEDMFYTKDVYKNPSNSGQQGNVHYTPYGSYNGGQRGAMSN